LVCISLYSNNNMIRTQVSDIKRNILETARELFFVKGYQNTSVNDIIEKTGSSKGAFYHHFKSKDELLDTISESIAQDSTD
jgi:AcrR family transcriptional regulator